MKLKKYLEQTIKYANKLIPLVLFLLILILVLKQLDMYQRIVGIYKTCLPVFMGLIIAFLFQPLIDRLKHRFSTRVAVMIVYIGTFVIGCLLLLILIPVIYHQVVEFVKVVPGWINKLEALLGKYHIAYDNLDTLKQEYIQESYIIVIDSLRNTMDSCTKFGIAYITAFFISADMDFWKRTAKKIVPNVHQLSTFYLTMSNIVYQYLVGTFFDLLFIIISIGSVLYLFQFPNAILYAIILALMNLFPYIGATIGLIIIAIVGALSYSQFPFVAFAIVWTIQQIEANFIQPLIFNRTMNVRPILTFVFIFISEAFFGVIGVILSPIFAAIAQIAFRSYLHSKTSDKVGKWEDIWQDFDEAMKTESYEDE